MATSVPVALSDDCLTCDTRMDCQFSKLSLRSLIWVQQSLKGQRSIHQVFLGISITIIPARHNHHLAIDPHVLPHGRSLLTTGPGLLCRNHSHLVSFSNVLQPSQYPFFGRKPPIRKIPMDQVQSNNYCLDMDTVKPWSIMSGYGYVFILSVSFSLFGIYLAPFAFRVLLDANCYEILVPRHSLCSAPVFTAPAPLLLQL